MTCPIVLECDRLLTNIGLPISVHSNEGKTKPYPLLIPCDELLRVVAKCVRTTARSIHRWSAQNEPFSTLL